MVIAGIVSGGSGSRMQKEIPKQYIEISGKPIIIHTIEKFVASPLIDAIVVGVHADWEEHMKALIDKYFDGKKKISIIQGGKTRNDTLKNLVDSAKDIFGADGDDIIVTHDAVRPFVTLKIIEENVKAAMKHGVCNTVVGATDTIVQSDNGCYITNIPLRNEMYQGQSPQSFKAGLFYKVYNTMTEDELSTLTDACKLFCLRGYKVSLVEGDVTNFKITYPIDLKLAKTIFEES